MFSRPLRGYLVHLARCMGALQVLLQHVSWDEPGTNREGVETQLSDLAAATLQHLASY